MHFRKKRTQDNYYIYTESRKKKRLCDFCIDEPTDKEMMFVHWKILKNLFPYDKITKHHDLLIPKRHFQNENEMTPKERKELTQIKTILLPKTKKYNVVWENFSHMRSVAHYHIHILHIK